MKRSLSPLLIAVFLISQLCIAEEIDLTTVPDDWKKASERMMVAAEEFNYRDDHENQKLWIFKPGDLKAGETRPCVFFIHGGGWGGSAYYFAPQCVYLSRLGVVCVTIHFRGPNPTPKVCLSDALSAYRWVKTNGKKHNIDPDKIVVSGGSAGGHLSLAMVSLSGFDNPEDNNSIPIDPKALVLFNPAIDLVEGWSGGRNRCLKAKINPEGFSPAHNVKPGVPETLILSGEKDGVITPAMIRKFMERMEKHGNKSTFVEYPGAGHSFFNYGKGGSNDYFFKTMKEVEKFLVKLGYVEKK